MLICCACAATYVLVWTRIYEDSTNIYLEFFPEGETSPKWTASRSFKIWIKTFGTWILLFTNMVPISLLVTLEIVKFF
jgi:magnesium-transporting ATPase (P-type)